MSGGILITGATGQVGSAVARALSPFSQDAGPIHTPGRSELNLLNPASIRRYIAEVKPRWIVNAAAYTAVDKAESDRVSAFDINAEAPRVLGEEAAKLHSCMIHFSTDYVFDGTSPAAYVETDSPGPMSVYGASKLAGEQALAETGANYFIFRTSWVYAATGRNFLLTILRLARERTEMKIVADQYGAPTAARDLAALTMHVLSSPPDFESKIGLFHATAAGETSWFGFAAEAVRQARLLNPDVPYADLLPIPTSEYPTPARRPSNSRMNCSKLSEQLGFTFPLWRDSLTRVMGELFPNKVNPSRSLA